jgi:glycosyltransferase involved in cell wall biosynthesis
MSIFFKSLDRLYVRFATCGGFTLELSASAAGRLSGVLKGVPSGDHAWLAFGTRRIPLDPGSPRTFTFSTRPGPKLITAWIRTPDGRETPVARRLIVVPPPPGSPSTATPPPVSNPPPLRVSVVVTNYNHATFLRQRLDSIYAQTFQPAEIILLDDASIDASASILADYAALDPVSGRTRVIRNSVNSGGPFAQWARGIREASGDLVWIAESDDWCELDFLAHLAPAFADPAVLIAHGLVDFVDAAGRSITQTHDALFRPLPSRKWRNSHVDTAHHDVQVGLGIRNTLPNASAVVFRRPITLPLLDDPEWRAMRVCGDWIFYLHRARGGKIAFVREAVNHYRNHPAGTALATRRDDRYVTEHAVVARHLAANYRLDPPVLDAQLRLLEKNHARQTGAAPALPRCLYDAADLPATTARRQPAVLVAVYAFAPGGAEAFGINLALALYRLGCAVTVADFTGLPATPAVRALLPLDFPVVRVTDPSPRVLARLLLDFGIEWISTHHPRCDLAFTLAKAALPPVERPVLFCTHHGFYHLDAANLFRHRARFAREVDLWINVATRGRLPFEVAGLAAIIASDRIIHIPAAVFQTPAIPPSRSSLDLPDDAFVICVASRALPEKGWREAVAAVARARDQTGLDLRLLLAGNGPDHDAFQAEGVAGFVRLLGFRSDVPALYAASDLGLLATTFGGESCPLTVIECLAAGRPMVVTAIGETPAMLAAADGTLAGALVAATPADTFVPRLADAIAALATDRVLLAAAAERARDCARRYDLMTVAADYLARFRARSPAIPPVV